MSDVCSHCGASAIELDEEGRVEVCSNCGVVCNEGSYRSDGRCQGGATTFNGGSFSGGGGENWRTKEKNRVHTLAFMYSKQCLQAQAERLRLPKEYITQVEEKMKSVYAEQLYKGLPRNRKAFVGSCVYIVCRQNDMVVTLRNVAEAARCDVSVLGRCVRMLTMKMNVHLETIEPEQIITNVLSQFDIQDPSTKKLVFDSYQFLSKTMICLGKRPVLTVMALVFMSTDSINGKTISKKKINEVCRLNTVKKEHVQRFVRTYRAELFKLAKRIPWLNEGLTPKQVPKFLKEIIEYYKDCEDFQSVDFKPQWLERKDIEVKEKLKKIENAEERVTACRQRCGDVVIDDSTILHKYCNQVPRRSTETSNSEVSPLPSSASVPSTSRGLTSNDKQTVIDHDCCPHCCINKQDCPVYQQTGKTSFCKLDQCDLMIECLLRKGYSRDTLVESNPESLFYSEIYRGDSQPDKEELDDDDICDEDIHLYIKSDTEVAETQLLKTKGDFLVNVEK